VVDIKQPILKIVVASLYPSLWIVIEILVKKYPSTTYLIGYQNLSSFIQDFPLAKDGEEDPVSRVCTI
jgi:hypothetical protein